MKKYYLNLFISALLLSLCSIESAWAKGEPTFYAKLKAEVGTGCSNMGKVYAGTSNSEGTYKAPSSTSGELNEKASSTEATSLELGPFYAFAKAEKGYKFVGWKETNTAAADIISEANPYSITLTSTVTTSGGYTKTLYAFFVAKTSVNITFAGTSMGTYQYTIGSSAAQTVSSAGASVEDVESVILSNPIPASGYAFAGWYQINSDGSVIDLSATSPTEVDFSASGTVTLGARFVSTTLPQFHNVTQNKDYYGLKAALCAAVVNDVISPKSTCTVNGADLLTQDNGTYVVPAGVTLLVPFNEGYTLYTTEPACPYKEAKDLVKPSVYRKITLASNIKIVVNGAISLSAKSVANQPYGACVDGPYGQIALENSSSIILKNNGKLYCWGYITGQGSVEAQSGSVIYELFQLACWRGGSAGSSMEGNGKQVFPLAQYYVQNIESKTVYEAGATEYVFTAVCASSTPFTTQAQLVGTNAGLFQLTSGQMTKWYDASVDRQMYEIEGNASLGTVTISVNAFILSVTINSEEYVLPLTNNMDISVKSGTLSCNEKIAVLPGAKITIDEGANVSMGAKSELYVYDKSEWPEKDNGYNYPGNVAFCKIRYTATDITTARTYANMKDAILDINGTLTTESGNFYTTSGKADICSSNGTGKVVYKEAPASKTPAAGSKTETYQATQGGTTITYVSIPITAAKLHNSSTWYSAPYSGDGKACEYLATAGAAANTTITYADGHWGWMEIWTDENNNVLYASNTAAKVNNASAKTCPTKTGYNGSWTTTSNATTDGLQKVLHKASYTPVSYTITYNNLEGASNSNPANYTIESANITLVNPGTRTGYDFGGWYTNEGLTTPAATPAIATGTTGNKTFYAKWTLKTYAITYDKGANGTGTVTAGVKTHGENYTLSTDKFTRTGYTQTGWSTTDGDAKAYDMGGTYSTDAAQTFYPFWTANEYTITYKDKDDATFSGVHGSGYPTTHTYGTLTALVNPTKYGYTFEGWYDNAACTGTALTEIGATAYTADFTLYAKWTIKSNCTITWLNYDGTPLYESTIQREGFPCYPEHLGTPKRLGDDNRTYTFKGWSPDIHDAYDDETYTAQYGMSITTGEPGTYTVSGTEDAVATTVQVSGKLNVSSGTLTTGDLIVEAYSNGSGTIDGLERVTVTGNAYFDYNFNTDPWHWSAFGVPFVIDLDEHKPLKGTTELRLGVDYDIVYYNSAERAAHGPSSKCWKYVEYDAEHKLTPGVLYMIAFNRPVDHVDVVRFTKASTASINYDGNLDLVITSDAAGNNKNWNGIANPRMYHALLHAGVTECQVHDGGEIGKDGYFTYDMQDKKFFVGKAAFVQVPNEQSVMTTTQATDQSAIVAKAPRRAKAQEGADRYDVQIAPMAEEMSDRVFLLTDEDKADEYVIVSDLAKAGVSPVRPQMWVNRYGVKLCKNTVAMRENIADYPLGISVPADGDYDIFLGERPNTDNMIYLTYDGEAIWNLSYGACTIELPRGTNDHYGLRVVAKSPQVATGIEEATIQNGDAVRKVIVEDKVFIIRNGQVYSIDGRLAK